MNIHGREIDKKNYNLKGYKKKNHRISIYDKMFYPNFDGHVKPPLRKSRGWNGRFMIIISAVISFYNVDTNINRIGLG